MQVATTLVLIVTCELCLAIRVPVSWDESASEVKQEIKNDNDEQFSVETFNQQTVQPQDVNTQEEKYIPVEYFQYTAKKPQFAVDVAKFHGVQSPENHYKAHPIKPYTGKARPELGKHHLLNKENTIHRPLQEFANINEDISSHAVPVSSNYEVFHPYDAEKPALENIYKDPILTKIRTDLENSKNRLQKYEKEAGVSDIKKDEYLESPEKTNSRFVPHRNIPAPYEIHRPQRRPIYYRPIPKHKQREQYLNQRLRHPWNQYSAKIRPVHYQPIKNHIHQLRQNHALKYDDERNEYPQVQILENHSSDPKDGYDIFERGKEKFVQLRNNVDESINKAVKENRPVTYQKLEMQNDDYANNDNSEDEFVPIKNYAQVRKTETFKHLPRSAAFADAENFDEISNAPRLREAVKSTKAQTVYSEEGYEDAAYDHAGEQKHAAENEGHGGYLKEHELSSGKYKTPSESAKYEDGGGSAYRDQVIHAEKWKNDNKDSKEEIDEEDYSEDEHEKLIEADEHQDSVPEDESHRNKRENDVKNDTNSDSSTQINKANETSLQHDVDKRNANFQVPELDLNTTFFTEQEILNIAKIKLQPKKNNIKQKYPYYFKNLKAISKHSPLRYAENLKFIPKKSNGGTEFYDSRSKFECPEVDDVPDPIPEKLNRDGHPEENDDDGDQENSSSKGDKNYDAVKTPRLKGLGDKIDCFKAKYFGENPLDSPFFKEEIISNPEPVTLPNLASYKLKAPFDNEQTKAESKTIKALDISSTTKIDSNPDIFDLIQKLRNEQIKLEAPLLNSNEELISSLIKSKNKSNIDNQHLSKQQSSVYSDVLDNITKHLKSEIVPIENNVNVTKTLTNSTKTPSIDNISYRFFQNKEDITQLPPILRKKRSNSFVYEPYKIIRDGQVQDSKKTTTTSNISPLIRQLQSSRVVDRVLKVNPEIDQSEKYVKRNINSRVYKDIGKTEREPNGSKNDKSSVDPGFVDISLDSRRGEPRYEIRLNNHKSKYTPVENKKSMSREDYKSQTSTDKTIELKFKGEIRVPTDLRQINPLARSNSVAASSNTVRKIISTTTTQKPTKNEEHNQRTDDSKSEEYDDYEEYDDEEEDEIATSTTTTTKKPSFRRKTRLTTTTEKVPEITMKPKLKLVTRFRDYKPDESSESQEYFSEKPDARSHKVKKEKSQEIDDSVPKYREKKKKSTKSTLVTDTKSYGDDDDDMRREEVDALIGVKQNMDDYKPLYEKEEENKLRKHHPSKGNRNEDDDEDEVKNKETKHIKKNDGNDGNDDDDDDRDEYYESDSDEDDNDNDDDDEDDNSDESEDSEDVIDDNDKDGDNNEEAETAKSKIQVTTPEPTKRTLAITTDAPTPTTATRNVKPVATPIVTRKKIEIHKELPVNKSAPHVTQFKQDIKEVEIIKEIPTPRKRKPQKNTEALELYKDDSLAKDINKLGGVEIFKEDIDLKNGPRHGGNYRSVVEPGIAVPLKAARNKEIKEDAEASQSEFTKHIELDEVVPSNKMHGGNLKSLNDAHKTRNRGRSSKYIELRNTPSTSMHGGNLKHRGRDRNIGKSQKFTEFDDDDEHKDDDPSNDHESFSNTRNSRPMHGGNYRSAKLVAEKNPEATEQPIRSQVKSVRRNSAAILNSFVQAAPILTTTPAYILDPSKRMYYYVDA